MKKRCKCGKLFSVSKSRLKTGRGKFCSNICKYRYIIRPSGLKYNIKLKNSGWFKKGLKPWNKGTKGLMPIPWNKGTLGLVKKNSGSFNSSNIRGKLNFNWKDSSVGYFALHTWLRRNFGIPRNCILCGSTDNVQWASKNYNYTRNKKDWLQLCFSCHRKYDAENGWGEAVRKYPHLKKKL